MNETRMKTALGLVLAISMFSGVNAQAQQALANASETPARPLWLMSCSNEQKPEELLCEFSQSLVMTQGNQGQRLATASFNRVAGKAETKAAFTVPYGVSLPDPVRVLVDNVELGTLTWRSCDLGGCYADAPAAGAWLDAMRKGKELVAALKTRDGRDLAFTFSLDGFTKAEQMLP